MTALSRFARLLRIPAHQAEDALHSERAARHVLSRRSFFGVSAAMAAGTVFSFGPADQVDNWLDGLGVLYNNQRATGESDEHFRERLRQQRERPLPTIGGAALSWSNIEFRFDQKVIFPITEVHFS